MHYVDFLPVELHDVQLVAVELDFLFAHALEVPLQPLARSEPHPVVGVAELDGEFGGKTFLDLLPVS